MASPPVVAAQDRDWLVGYSESAVANLGLEGLGLAGGVFPESPLPPIVYS